MIWESNFEPQIPIFREFIIKITSLELFSQELWGVVIMQGALIASWITEQKYLHITNPSALLFLTEISVNC